MVEDKQKVLDRVISSLNETYQMNVLELNDNQLKQVLTTFDYIRLTDAFVLGIDQWDIETCIDCGSTLNKCAQRSGSNYKCWI